MALASGPPLDWAELETALLGASSVLLIGHVNPDADTIGSCLGLAQGLAAVGTQVQVCVGTPGFVMPRSLDWLPGQEFVVPPEGVLPADVALAIDCSSRDRLGVLADTAASAPCFAAIDHHASYDGFARTAVVDPTAAAAGVLVAEMIDRLGVEWTADIATCIYASISSDTGSFRYSGTSADTLRLAADMLDLGIDHAGVARALFGNRDLGLIRLAGDTMKGARHHPDALDGRGALIGVIGQGVRNHHDVAYDEVESIIADLAANGVVEVTAVIKEDDAGSWKVSMRSRGGFDVSELSTRLGGGGHRAAAGYTSSGDLQATLGQLWLELGIPNSNGQ